MRDAAFNRLGLALEVTTRQGEFEVIPVRYRTIAVDRLDVFYREAGNPEAPKLLLLHGFPSSSHMFRDLIPRLADRFQAASPESWIASPSSSASTASPSTSSTTARQPASASRCGTRKGSPPSSPRTAT